MRLVPLAAVLVLCLGGCATARLATPTGRPEVSISGVGTKEVMDSLVSRFVATGWQPREVSAYHVELTRPEQGLGTAVLTGSTQSEHRLTCTVTAVGDGVHVVAQLRLVAYAGSARERWYDLSDGKSGQQLQEILEGLRDRLQARRH